jgi:hypothetical protein
MNLIKMSNLDKCLTYPAGVQCHPKNDLLASFSAAKKPKMDMDQGI